MIEKALLPSVDRLRELLDYDPQTGIFTWKLYRPGSNRTGQQAGCVTVSGYRRINIDGAGRYAARLAWIMERGEIPDGFDVDHINGERSDDRLANLRLASRQQNNGNRRRQHNNKSGVKGVHWDGRNKRWVAQIAGTSEKPRHRLGRFKTIEEARQAYAIAARERFGEFARVD